MNEHTRDLLVRGVAAAKANEKDEARFFLEWVLRLDPPEEQRLEALYWLGEASQDPARKRECLEEILARRPQEARARRSLAILEGRLDPAEIVDPDRLPAPNWDEGPVAAERFVCPQCGGRLVYTPDGQALTCEYCTWQQGVARAGEQTGGGLPVAEGASDALGFTVAMATAAGHSGGPGVRSFECRACGASFLLAPAALSVNCPYCGSTYVVDTTGSKTLTPPGQIIPFQVPEAQARQVLQAWFASRGMRAQSQTAVFQGRYLPAWKFRLSLTIPLLEADNEASGALEGKGGESFLLEDTLVAATASLPEACIDGNLSFDLEGLRPFDPAYLVDWPAETYQVSLSQASLQARFKLLEGIRQQAAAHPDSSRRLGIQSMDLVIDSFSLVLLPLWFVRFWIEGQEQGAIISGQSGALLPTGAAAQGDGPGSERSHWVFRLFSDE